MNSRSIIHVKVQSSGDVVLVRQRAQALAELAQFDNIKQTSFATAISEIARNAIQFASEAQVQFSIESHGDLHYLTATIVDHGPGIKKIRDNGGIWDRNIVFEGVGIASARRLVKSFSINCPPAGGTTVKLGIAFPANYSVRSEIVGSWMKTLAVQKPRNLLEEINHRNQELVITLEALQRKEAELELEVAAATLANIELAEAQQSLEARVKERTESLTISNAELRDFSYTVSHDLRAPLRAINGFIHILLEQCVKTDDADSNELAKNILQATDRMDCLIQDLVAYTQVSKAPIPLQEVDSRGLIDELVKQCEPRFQSENARVELQGEFPMVQANPAILQSALVNLFENALKFRSSTQQASVIFRGAPNSGKLRLWVEDSGIGIAPEHHAQIFRVFERLHGREIAGTGIGLALVKRWITGMQGAVGVESKLGEGARFWIDLPLSSSATTNGVTLH